MSVRRAVAVVGVTGGDGGEHRACALKESDVSACLWLWIPEWVESLAAVGYFLYLSGFGVPGAVKQSDRQRM